MSASSGSQLADAVMAVAMLLGIIGMIFVFAGTAGGDWANPNTGTGFTLIIFAGLLLMARGLASQYM